MTLQAGPALAAFSWWTEFRVKQQICSDADDDESEERRIQSVISPSVCLSLEQDSKREGHRPRDQLAPSGGHQFFDRFSAVGF
jgi:hypothetical protein